MEKYGSFPRVSRDTEHASEKSRKASFWVWRLGSFLSLYEAYMQIGSLVSSPIVRCLIVDVHGISVMGTARRRALCREICGL